MQGEERTVDRLPECHFCRLGKKHILARYDGRTKKGPWRMMCLKHFKEHGRGVGIGKGQRLWLPHEKHGPGEAPRAELPPPFDQPQAVDCDICGTPWFLKAIDYIAGRGYCPNCLRKCFPLRAEGPFTFGDYVVATWPEEDDDTWGGDFIARVMQIPETNVIEIRVEIEDEEPEDVQLALDGLGHWWDVTNQIPNIKVRFATAQEAKQSETWRKNRIGSYAPERPEIRDWHPQAPEKAKEKTGSQGRLF